MGNNVNLSHLLGIPKKNMCPSCGCDHDNMYDDYDIDCGTYNPEFGAVKLHAYCPECECEYTQEIKITHLIIETRIL